ncbi:MAG: polysaccharide biosynthesis C-terminal domain-containing protein, partial [Acidobacteriota bacterium]|nr:polysaccharide biosynthesis C-terminal domain-containing protein [Acidobacteriota bacterium]
ILVCAVIVWTIGRAIHEQKNARAFKADAGLFKRTARYGLKFHVSIIAAFLIIRADLLIVNHFRGSSETAVYSVASQVASLLLLLPGIVATLLFPRITSAQATSAEFTMRVTRHMSLVMLAICVAAAPLSFALPLVYGAAFADAPVQLLILLPGVFLMGLESVLVQYFNSRGVPKVIPAFWVLLQVINVLLNILFVPRFGARAAALSSTLCYTLVFLFVAIYFLRETGNSAAETFVPRRGELRELLRMRR